MAFESISITGSLFGTSSWALNALAGVVLASDTVPTTGFTTGSLWFNSDLATLNVRYQDDDGGQWIGINAAGPTITASFANTAATASWALNAVNGTAIPNWTNGGQISVTATTTAPSKGGTRNPDVVYYRGVGANEREVWYNYYQTTAGTTGTGDYLFNLPGGYQFNTTIQPTYTGAFIAGTQAYMIPMIATCGISTFTAANMYYIPYNSTQFRVVYYEGSPTLRMLNSNTSTSITFASANFFLNFRFTFTAA